MQSALSSLQSFQHWQWVKVWCLSDSSVVLLQCSGEGRLFPDCCWVLFSSGGQTWSMSYCTEALALRADYSRSKTVTRTYFEWLWCWIIPSSGGGGEPWIEFVRAVRNCTAKSPWGMGMLLWQLCAALQDLLLQPCGDTEMECGPVLQPCLDTCTGTLEIPHWAIPVLHLCLLLLCEFSAGAGQAMGWVSVFLPWTHVHKLEQVSLSAGSVLPCPYSHGLWGVMAILPLLVTGLRLQISATRPEDSSGFGSVPGLPEALFSCNSNF